MEENQISVFVYQLGDTVLFHLHICQKWRETSSSGFILNHSVLRSRWRTALTPTHLSASIMIRTRLQHWLLGPPRLRLVRGQLGRNSSLAISGARVGQHLCRAAGLIWPGTSRWRSCAVVEAIHQYMEAVVNLVAAELLCTAGLKEGQLLYTAALLVEVQTCTAVGQVSPVVPHHYTVPNWIFTIQRNDYKNYVLNILMIANKCARI